jgi:AcrR family transcriptional regulator
VRQVRRGRPRSQQAADGILAAAQDLLLSGGYDDLCIEDVAARAGVAKTTLYRRWPTKDHLLVALVAKIQDNVPVTDTQDLRHDLSTYLNAIADALNHMRRIGRPHQPDDRSAGVVAAIAAAAARHADVGAALRAQFAHRNALAHALLEGARQRGDLRPDADPAVLFDQLAGAIYYRVLVTGEPVDAAYVQRLVDSVLATAQPPTAPQPERPHP